MKFVEKWIHAPHPWVRQGVRFFISGILTNILKYGVFLLLFYVFSLHYMWASSLAYLAAFLTAFVINRNWAFEVKQAAYASQLMRFTLVNAFSFAVNLAVIWIFTEIFNFHPAVSQLAAIAVSMVTNFCGCKFWAFR